MNIIGDISSLKATLEVHEAQLHIYADCKGYRLASGSDQWKIVKHIGMPYTNLQAAIQAHNARQTDLSKFT